jgi:hypothetical protein
MTYVNVALAVAFVLLLVVKLVRFRCPKPGCNGRLKHLGFTSKLRCEACGLTLYNIQDRGDRR